MTYPPPYDSGANYRGPQQPQPDTRKTNKYPIEVRNAAEKMLGELLAIPDAVKLNWTITQVARHKALTDVLEEAIGDMV